ncbi:unnamed protein product [Fusarium fujikuroi]|nr:unnamed protein product [Fusarium fujikuroi]
MANTLTLSSAVVAGGPFEQQGSIDWVQIARMSVSVPISILARVTAADISPLTIVVGQEMSSLFRLSTTGHERLIKALGELKSFSAIGDAIWFGFGIKHIVRVLAETHKGLTCLTLCACLSEIHTPKACAEILIRLADACDAPEDLRPSASQWINLVEACSGTLRSTTFACIAEQFMAFHRHHVSETYADEAADVAKALLAVARVSSGVLSSVTLTGGRSCGWIAAIGFYFLGLEVEIRSADYATIYKSTTNYDSIRLLVIYETAQSPQVQVSSTEYFINSIDNVMSSPEQRFDTVMSGTIQWGRCLSTTFGEPIGQLLKAKEDFGLLIGAAALVFQGLTNSETSSISDGEDGISWFGFRQSQYGIGFANSVTSLFPELSRLFPYIRRNMNMSVDDSVKAYDRAYENLTGFCKCYRCSNSEDSWSYCLGTLAETIIFLTWNVSALQIHADLKPYHSGLIFIYQLHSREAMAWGICFYFDILREVSDRPEDIMTLHVVPGIIQTKAGRKYSFIADKTSTMHNNLLHLDPRDNMLHQRTAEYKVNYQARITEKLRGNMSISTLSMDTGSSDLNVKLCVEESTSGLLVDLHFLSFAGTCRVGAYTMLKEIIENSGLVSCTHRNCPGMNQINCNVSVADGEGSMPEDLPPKVYVRRLAGNPLARCVGLLVNRAWRDPPPILRQGECIPCCVRTAANMRYDHPMSPSYVIL